MENYFFEGGLEAAIVDWTMKAERDATLVMDALMKAVWRRGKAGALLHHSDQGSQYTSEQFQRLLADNGISCSMSRARNVWDNSAMESFFSSLKIERTNRMVLPQLCCTSQVEPVPG